LNILYYVFIHGNVALGIPWQENRPLRREQLPEENLNPTKDGRKPKGHNGFCGRTAIGPFLFKDQLEHDHRHILLSCVP